MTQSAQVVNINTTGTIAPLTNVALFSDLMAKLINRPAHLPGIGILFGPSGYGKTESAKYAANKHRAFYLEVGESWTKRHFLKALLYALGADPRGTAADMIETAVDVMRDYRRPLIVDEADHIVRRGYIETIREIYDKTRLPIALLGEELFPQLVEQASERCHNRVLLAKPAQSASVDDAAILAQLFHPEVLMASDLLAALTSASGNRLRRIVVNLYDVATEAKVQGWKAVDLAAWGTRPFSTGAAGKRGR